MKIRGQYWSIDYGPSFLATDYNRRPCNVGVPISKPVQFSNPWSWNLVSQLGVVRFATIHKCLLWSFQLNASVEGRRKYLFRCDFSSCSESAEIWHADSFAIQLKWSQQTFVYWSKSYCSKLTPFHRALQLILLLRWLNFPHILTTRRNNIFYSILCWLYGRTLHRHTRPHKHLCFKYLSCLNKSYYYY